MAPHGPSTQTGRDGTRGGPSEPQRSWEELLRRLTKLERGAREKSEELGDEAKEVLQFAQAMRKEANSTLSVEKVLKQIENGVSKILHGKSEVAPTQQRSWASVAAMPALQPPRPTVRVRLEEDTKDKTPTEILNSVKPKFPQAVAVHKLQSGDVDIRLKSHSEREAVLRQPAPSGVTVLQRDFLVEVPGVPLTVPVRNGRAADNTTVIKEIEEASIRLTGPVKIRSIRWLRAPEPAPGADRMETDAAPNSQPTTQGTPQGTQRKAARTRGSLIIGVATHEEQMRLVRSGVVIYAMYYEPRLYTNSVGIVQCFRCGQWGHKQTACTKQRKCMQCAGPHDTRECTEERVRCSNCAQKHRAWQRQGCEAFQRYRRGVDEQKSALLQQTWKIQRDSYDQFSGAITRSYTFTASRPTASPYENPPLKKRKGPGRPTNAEALARRATQDLSQARFSLNVPSSFPSTDHSSLGGASQAEEDSEIEI